MASFSDTFDRANGEIGANWVEDNGDIDIVSNVAESQTVGDFNRARYASQLDSANHFVQATIGGRSTTNHGAVSARQVDAVHTHYKADYVSHSAADGYRLRKVVEDTETDLDSATSTTGARVIKIEVDGATQEMFVDDVSIASATDAAITAGRYAGIACFSNNGGRWDTWSAADLAGGPAPPAGTLAFAGYAFGLGTAILMPDEP